MNTTEFTSHHFTIIGQNSKLIGEITLQDEAQFWGHLTGNISTNEKLTLERTSHIEGNIECQDLLVSGVIHGEIRSRGLVTLYSSAKVIGKIIADEIQIHPGAHLEVDMNTDL